MTNRHVDIYCAKCGVYCHSIVSHKASQSDNNTFCIKCRLPLVYARPSGDGYIELCTVVNGKLNVYSITPAKAVKLGYDLIGHGITLGGVRDATDAKQQ